MTNRLSPLISTACAICLMGCPQPTGAPSGTTPEEDAGSQADGGEKDAGEQPEPQDSKEPSTPDSGAQIDAGEQETQVMEDRGPPPECVADSDCNDFNNCTQNQCVEGDCSYPPIPGCCKTDTDCDDGVECTIDECNSVKGECLYSFEDNSCCKSADDCAKQPDSEILCAANTCVYPKLWNYKCVHDLLCDDGNSCTEDKCKSTACVYTPLQSEGCCTTDADCDDGNATTYDSCQLGLCWHKALSCASDWNCQSPLECVTGACVEGTCSFSKQAGCCSTNTECNDGVALTTDECLTGSCVHHLGALQACDSGAACQVPNACANAECISGACSYTSSGADGCCNSSADCGPGDACSGISCDSFQCKSAPTGAKTVHWESNFDSGELQGWTPAGGTSVVKWQISSNQAISKPNSLYYGDIFKKDYDVGKSSGTVTSPEITPPEGTVLLSFQRNCAVEPGTSSDKVTLTLIEGGKSTQIWDKGYQNGPGAGWKLVELDISFVSGPFKLRFAFDSVDGKQNHHEGVYVDDVKILSPCSL